MTTVFVVARETSLAYEDIGAFRSLRLAKKAMGDLKWEKNDDGSWTASRRETPYFDRHYYITVLTVDEPLDLPELYVPIRVFA